MVHLDLAVHERLIYFFRTLTTIKIKILIIRRAFIVLCTAKPLLPVHLTNANQRQAAADPCTKPIYLVRKFAYTLLSSTPIIAARCHITGLPQSRSHTWISCTNYVRSRVASVSQGETVISFCRKVGLNRVYAMASADDNSQGSWIQGWTRDSSCSCEWISQRGYKVFESALREWRHSSKILLKQFLCL